MQGDIEGEGGEGESGSGGDSSSEEGGDQQQEEEPEHPTKKRKQLEQQQKATAAAAAGSEQRTPAVVDGPLDLSFTPPVPESYQEFVLLVGGRPAEQLQLAIQRIRTFNAAAMATDNKRKLQVRDGQTGHRSQHMCIQHVGFACCPRQKQATGMCAFPFILLLSARFMISPVFLMYQLLPVLWC